MIVGGGIAGLTAALALARVGAELTLLDGRPDPDTPAADTQQALPGDGRTTAVLMPGVRFLTRLGVWARIVPQAVPLQRLRLVSLGVGNTPEADVTFAARELGLPAFGHNVENGALRLALRAALRNRPNATLRFGAPVEAIRPAPESVRVNLADGSSLTAGLVVGADGRNSVVRAAAGIALHGGLTGQTAIVTRFRHTRPHHFTSIELHRRGGPFTMVPLAGPHSSLVWVERDEAAQALLGLPQVTFAAELARRVRPWLGEPSEIAPPSSYRIANARATALTAPGLLILGEAAHALSPLGAQGFNLSLRDVEALMRLAAEALAGGRRLGDQRLLTAYEGSRRADIRARSVAVAALGFAVDSDALPLRAARVLGLRAVGALPPARRALMEALMQPVRSTSPTR